MPLQPMPPGLRITERNAADGLVRQPIGMPEASSPATSLDGLAGCVVDQVAQAQAEQVIRFQKARGPCFMGRAENAGV